METVSLNIYSFIYHPTITDVDNLENSNRGIFPTSLYRLVENQENTGDITITSQPIIFRISSDNMVKSVYVTAHEFSAMEDMVYISSNLMNDSFLNNGSKVNVNIVSLPSITKLVLQPKCNRFAKEIDDPKAALEIAIVERYQVINLGDTLKVGNYQLEVKDLEPSEAVITNEADPEVDFQQCWEDIQRERQMKIAKLEKEREQQEKLSKQQQINNQKEKNRLMEENYRKTGHKCIPFGGMGRKLDGSIVPEQNSEGSIHNISNDNSDNKKNSQSARNLRDYSIFAGKGRKINE